MPQKGPNANAPISTGSSAKSNFKNTGMNGSGISRYMSRTAIAVRMAHAAIRRIIIVRVILESALTVTLVSDIENTLPFFRTLPSAPGITPGQPHLKNL